MTPRTVKDLHGMDQNEAEQLIHNIVGEVRNSKTVTELELITGHGVLRQLATVILEGYQLKPHIKWSNTGVVVCTIE